MSVREIFAKRLLKARKTAGYTQAQLAEKIGMTQGGYTAYERCRREPKLATIVKLAEVLDRPISWFLEKELSGDE